MTPAQILLQERLDDLRHNDGGFVDTPGHAMPAGTVRTTVDHLLDAAWGALWERQHEDADGVLTACDHVDEALAVLTAYRTRLGQLHEIDTEESALAAGWTKSPRGVGWLRPEDAPEAASA